MTNVYDFEAPQFVNFNSGLDDSDEADKFFDVEEETPGKDGNKGNKLKNTSVITETTPMFIDEESMKTECSPKNDNKAVFKTSVIDEQAVNSNKKRREMLKAVRRLSEIKIKNELCCSDNSSKQVEDDLSQNLNNVSLRARKRTHFEGIDIAIKNEKQHCMTTRNDEKIKTPKIELRSRTVTKGGNPPQNLKRKSMFVDENKAPEKYMAMAEHILHFQRDTPPRFHSHRRQSTGVNGSLFKKRQSYKPRRTIALTPKLMTSLRSRPVDVPSLQQREELEIEDMKKHQIKANPLNEKVFLPPQLPKKSEQQKTEPAPFKLTQVSKKPIQEIEEPYRFTANPVPRTILEKPVGVAPKKERPVTVPESPAITKPVWAYKRVKVAAISNKFQESTEDLKSFGVPAPALLKKTDVKPFSFETRDKQMLERKQQKLKEVFEAEKKAREFRAKPVPSFVASKDTTVSSMKSHLDCSKASIKSLAEVEEPPKTFKARSPRVLRKEPFRPVTEHSHSEPMNIQLHTDRRALQRQQFEQKKAEKEEEIAGLKQMMEMKKKEEEEAEIAKMRKDAVHKAQPMPKFKSVPLNLKVSSSKPVTNPQSPKFTKLTRTTTLCSSTFTHK